MTDTPDAPPTGLRPGRTLRFLDWVARVGNRLPDPITLFVIFALLVIVLSAIFAGAAENLVQRDGTVKPMTIRSLATGEGLRWMMESAVQNFVSFAPLGKVLVVMLGIGVAERSGLIGVALRTVARSVPKVAITATLVFLSVMGSVALDGGIVLIPLGAALFAGLGRHPLAGLSAAFAGVVGGFSANLLITGLDPLLAGLTQEAARAIDPTYVVDATANYFFMIASTFLITVVGTLVTTRIVEPLLGPWDPSCGSGEPEPNEIPTAQERRALRWAGVAGLLVAGGIVFLAAWPDSPLRQEIKPGAPSIAAMRPFFASIEPLIALAAFIPGVVYGIAARSVRSDRDVATMLSDTMATMGTYVALAFVAAQFVAYFNWTHLGSVTAVKGAHALQSIGLEGIPLMLAFLVLSAAMNMLLGSASAKWAFMAPIFVPMLMQMGFSPESVQATYRVGDSVTNLITPLMPYMPLIIVFAKRYDRKAGLGTILAAMLPYSIAFGIAWAILLGIWLGFAIPLGPGVPTHY